MPIYQDPGSAAQNVAAEYVEVSGGQTSTNLVQAVDHIKFDTINRQVGASITPDVLTPYTSINGINSLGRFLLQPGLLYELEGDIGDVTSGGVGSYITYDWANADTGAILTAGSGGSNIVGANLSSTNQGRTLAKATFLPTVATRVELRIRQIIGITGYGGQFSSNRATARIRVLSGQALVSATAGATAGDIKFSGLTTDHSGNWILLDGRLKSALTPAQQTVATSLGYGTNIPDMRGRMAVGVGGTLGAALNAIGGSLSIAQNALPNVTLPVSGSAGLGGSGIWWYNGTTGNARMPNGGGVFDAQSTTSLTVSGNTASINGGVTQQNFISPYFANNWFVWLGSSASTVTVASSMVGANGTVAGTGGTVPAPAATDNTKFLRGDGTWVLPPIPKITVFNSSGIFTADPQAKYTIVEMVGGGGAGGTCGSVSTSQINVASGGGAGGYIKALLTPAQIGLSQAVTIGAGGTPTGGTGGGGTLVNATTFGTLLTASGGGGGANSSRVGTPLNGMIMTPITSGGGATVTTGTDLGSSSGGAGFGGAGSAFFTNPDLFISIFSGKGGDSKLFNGGGSQASVQASSNTGNVASTGNGGAGSGNSGCGGGGGYTAGGAGQGTGGAGGSGRCIITEYFN
jgi:hypothetical protein